MPAGASFCVVVPYSHGIAEKRCFRTSVRKTTS
ncbi:hypothetical protein ACLK19_14815 [Escherichia coli]